MTPDSARRRRRTRLAILAASAIAHLGLLALLARASPELLASGATATPTFQVALEAAPSGGAGAARPSLQPERSTADAPVPSAPTRSRTEATPSPLAAAPAPSPAPSRTPAVTASSPGAAPAVAVAGQGDGRWRLRGGGGGDADGAARALARTTAGCDHQGWLHLTAAERDRCDRPFLEGMRSGMKIDAIPAAKRAYYDQVQAAYAKMHEPTPMSINIPTDARFGNLGVDPQWRAAAGAHMPGFGCAIKFGIPRGYESYHDKPPHSLKLGALPCFVAPPSGLFTEEADVQAPASRREQEDDAAHAAKYAPLPTQDARAPAPRP